jgi:hypothetical protein
MLDTSTTDTYLFGALIEIVALLREAVEVGLDGEG